MVVRIKKRTSGGTRNDTRTAASVAKRRRANVSRKEVMKVASAKKRARTIVKQAKALVKDAHSKAQAVKAKNKKVKRVMHSSVQKAVNEGLLDAVRNVGAEPTPLTLFACATTAILRDGSAGVAGTRAKVPYLVSAVGSCVRHLSPGVLISKLDVVLNVVNRVISDFGSSDHTALAKAYRLATDVAIRVVSAPIVQCLEGCARAQLHNDEKRVAQLLERMVDHTPKLFARAFGALKNLEPSKMNAVSMNHFITSLRKVALHLFNLDEHHKVLFGIYDQEEGAGGSDDEWEDVSDDDDDGVAAPVKPKSDAELTAPSAAATELLWCLRKQVLDSLPEVTATLLGAMVETSPVVAKGSLDNLSEVLTVTCGRCVAEFAGFVLREGGHVEQSQAEMLTDVLDPVIRQIVDVFRVAGHGKDNWSNVATLITRFFGNSKITIFKRSSYAPAAVALANSMGVPPPLFRIVKNPSGSAVQAGARTPDEHQEFVASNDGAAAHHQKRLPSLFDIAPSTSLLLRVLDKIRSNDDANLNKAIEEAIVAIGNCCSFKEFMNVLPWNVHTNLAADADDDDDDDAGAGGKRKRTSQDDLWRRSYLAHNVWRKIAHHDSIAVFASEFLPRIADCIERVAALTEEGRMHEMQQFQALHDQYWRVAVGFFTFPVEFDEIAFRNIAKGLVGNLKAAPGETGLGASAHASCAALHTLCTGYYDLASSRDAFEDDMMDEDDDDEEDGADGTSGEAAFGDLLLEQDDDVLHPHLHHFIPAAHAMRVCALIAKYSKNIMPKLCNAAEQLEDVSGTPIFSAISSFSKVCAPATMEAILTGILDVGANIAAGIAAGDRVMSAQRRVILDIAIGIVPQLETQFLEAMVGIVETAILAAATGEIDQARPAVGTLQKKGYRLLFELFEHRLSDMSPYLASVVTALQNASSFTLPAAKKGRLRCLTWALDACKIHSDEQLVDFGLTLVDEVVLSVRERAQMARQLAMDWFERFFQYCDTGSRTDASGQLATHALLLRVLASIAGKTPLSISASILVSAKLLWCGLRSNALTNFDVPRVLRLVFALQDHAATEVRNACAVFARMTLKLMGKYPALRGAVCGTSDGSIAPDSPLALLLRAIAVTVSQPHVASATRTQMRQLIERVLDRFELSHVEAVFPAGSRRFLTYVDKQQRRAARLKKRETDRSQERALVAQLSIDRAAGRAVAGQGDGDDENFDLLGESGIAQMASTATTSNAAASKRVTAFVDDDGDGEEDDDQYVLRMSKAGKMQVMSRSEFTREAEEQQRNATAEKLMQQAQNASRGGASRGALQGPTIAAGTVNDDGKRRRTAATEDFENEELFRNYGGMAAEGGSGGPSSKPSSSTVTSKESAQSLQKLKRNRMESDIRRGEEYASKTGMGDVRKGNLEPHAYVPLSRAMLNKRNQSQRVKRFQAVEHKALKGQKAQRAAAAMKAAKGTGGAAE